MNFTKKVLDNGLRIITVPMKDNPTVTVLVMVEAGSKYETKDIGGISHFLEHMCFKGTKNRPRPFDISKELDGVGAEFNAFTSHEHTGYYAKSDAKHFDLILDVVSDIYLNQTLPEKELEKEKGVIVEEINMYEDLPQRQVWDILMELLYKDQPAGRNVAGTKETVRATTREKMVDYRRKHYVSGATTVVVAGKINEKEVLKAVSRKFKDMPSGKKHGKSKVIEKQRKPEIKVKSKNTDQVHLIVAVRAYDINHKDIVGLKVLDAVLGGGMSARLFQKMREELAIGYYVKSYPDLYTDHGALVVAAGVDRTRVKEGVDAIVCELKKLRDEAVSPEELKKAKEYLIGNMYLSLEGSDEVAEYYAYQEILKKKIISPKEIAEKVQAITSGDIKRIAKNILKDQNLNLVIVGRIENEEEIRDILHF